MAASTPRIDSLEYPSANSVTRTAGNINNASTSLVDLTGATVTLVLDRAAKIQWGFIGSWRNTVAGNNSTINIDVNGSLQLGAQGLYETFDTSNYFYPISISGLTAELPAGTYTVKVQWRVSGGTGTMLGDTNNPYHFFAKMV